MIAMNNKEQHVVALVKAEIQYDVIISTSHNRHMTLVNEIYCLCCYCTCYCCCCCCCCFTIYYTQNMHYQNTAFVGLNVSVKMYNT